MARNNKRGGRYASAPQKSKKRAMPLLFAVAGIALLCLIGGIAAKYIQTTDEPGNQIGAKDFYFTMDLFKVDEAYPEDTDENAIVERQVHLYGTSQKELVFKVQNFFDEFRVNADPITYTVTYTTSPGLNATVHEENASVQSSYTLSGGSQASQTFYVTATGSVTDGAQVVVTVKSTAPYTKTMVLTVVLHPQQEDVLYRVEDEVGANHAKLIIMASKALAADAIQVDWSAINGSENALQIDSTNAYMNPVIGSASFAKTAVSKKVINQDESITVYFFKADPSMNYSMPNTVAALSGGKYQVIMSANTTN